MAYASQQWVKNLIGQTLKTIKEQGLFGGDAPANQAVLDKLSDTSGKLYYDGKVVGGDADVDLTSAEITAMMNTIFS